MLNSLLPGAHWNTHLYEEELVLRDKGGLNEQLLSKKPKWLNREGWKTAALWELQELYKVRSAMCAALYLPLYLYRVGKNLAYLQDYQSVFQVIVPKHISALNQRSKQEQQVVTTVPVLHAWRHFSSKIQCTGHHKPCAAPTNLTELLSTPTLQRAYFYL